MDGKLATAGKGCLVSIKALLREMAGNRHSKILSFFSLFAVLKNKLLFLLRNAMGSKSSTVNSNPKKRAPDPRYFQFGKWPKVTLCCLLGTSRIRLGIKT